MSFFDNLKAAAIEKVKEKVKKELAELGIDLDEDDVDDAAAAADDEKENKDGEERPIFCAGPPSPSSASFPSQPDANTTFQDRPPSPSGNSTPYPTTLLKGVRTQLVNSTISSGNKISGSWTTTSQPPVVLSSNIPSLKT